MVLESTPRPELPGNPTYMTQDLQWMTTARSPTWCATGLKATRIPPRPHGIRAHSCASSRPCRQASTRARWPWQRKCVPTLPLAGDDTAALVEAAMARLRTGGYTYTLEPGVYGEHTADEFWFDRKEGFCEHIASASWC